MKSTTLENLYDNINKKILLVQSYTENPNVSFIIKACRLKPLSVLDGQNKNELVLEKKWFDEFGNSFNIIKNKRLKIILGDLSIDRTKINTTDLYYGLSLEKVSKISKLLFLFIGKEEDNSEEHLIISFLGIDNYLRTFSIYDGQINPCSSLELGITILRFITENKDIKYFTEIKHREMIIFPCTSQNMWLSFWPSNKKFLEIVSKHSEIFSQIINTQEIRIHG